MHSLALRYLLDPLLASGAFALALSLAALLSLACRRMGGIFAEAVEPSGNKLASLEGLRGILAFAVVIHHGCAWYAYTQTQVWTTGNSILFERFANFGVMQFFFISGYLFWRKLMKKGGIDLRRFYLSRFVRLAPVYYVTVGIAILIGFSLSGFHLLVSVRELAVSLVPWLLFSLGGQPSINGADVKRVVSGVIWTLANEWLFYLSLPFLAWFARKSVRILHLIALFLFVFLVSKYLSSGRIHHEAVVATFLVVREFAKFMVIGFGGGIVIAAFQEDIARRLRLSINARNWLVLVLYAFYLLAPNFRGGIVLRYVALLIAFSLVIEGADLFGFITSMPMRFLGIISYDLYLVHGITYYLAMRLRGGIHSIAPGPYIAQAAVCIVVIILTSTVLHFLVERPSMKLSEKIARNPAVTSMPVTAEPQPAQVVSG